MAQVPNPVRPTDPIFRYGWAARSQDGHEGGVRQRGYDIGYHNDPNLFVYDEFHREGAGGLVQRYLCEPERRTRYADGTFGVGNSRWWGIPSERRDIIIWNIRERWREDDEADRPRMTFGFYCGSDNYGAQWSQDSWTMDGVLNLQCDRDRRRFLDSLGPWLDMGLLSEVWWDAGSRDDYYEDCKELLTEQRRRYGLHGGVESIRHSRDDDPRTPWPGDITWEAYDGFPRLCISRFILDRNPANDLAWADGDECHIMSSSHARIDGTPGSLTPQQARDFTARGWTVGSWLPEEDGIVGLPPGPRPGG